MITGPIAIVGSTNRGDALIQAEAKTAAYHLGKALAKRRLRILVYFDDPIFLETEVVRGYVDSGIAAEGSIEVRYPEKKDASGVPKPPPFVNYYGQPSFAFQPDDNPEWEVSFYQSLGDIGGMLVLQGGSSTLIAGLIALGYNKPVLPCSGFGGTAVKLGSVLAERGLVTQTTKTRLQVRPDSASLPAWADDCVNILLLQAAAIEAKRQEQARADALVKRRETAYIIVAAFFAAISLGLCIVNWDNTLGLSPLGVRLLLFCVAALSGATGAMLWSTVPFLRRRVGDTPASIWGTAALGLMVGCFTTLIYLIAQERGFPDFAGAFTEEKVAILKADYLAKLFPSVVLTALVAGLTLDRAFKGLLKKRADSD